MVRLWVQSRGTLKFPTVNTSVIVPDDAIVDDVRAAIRERVAPLLDNVPGAYLTVQYYSKPADDYVVDSVQRVVTVNPLPEVLATYPGATAETPLYFELSPAGREYAEK